MVVIFFCKKKITLFSNGIMEVFEDFFLGSKLWHTER